MFCSVVVANVCISFYYLCWFFCGLLFPNYEYTILWYPCFNYTLFNGCFFVLLYPAVITRTVQLVHSICFVNFYRLSTPEQLGISENADTYLNFFHDYNVHNIGPSPLYNGTIQVCIPTRTLSGKLILTTDRVKVI